MQTSVKHMAWEAPNRPPLRGRLCGASHRGPEQGARFCVTHVPVLTAAMCRAAGGGALHQRPGRAARRGDDVRGGHHAVRRAAAAGAAAALYGAGAQERVHRRGDRAGVRTRGAAARHRTGPAHRRAASGRLAGPGPARAARSGLHLQLACMCASHLLLQVCVKFSGTQHSAEDGRRPIHGMRRSTTMHSCTGALRAMTGSAPRPCAGAVYLLLKAVSYFVGSFLSLPAVAGVLAALRSKAGL